MSEATLSQLTIALFLWGIPALASGFFALLGYGGRRPSPMLAGLTFATLLLVPLVLIERDETLALMATRLPASPSTILAVPAALGAMVVQAVHTAWHRSTLPRPSVF